MLIAIGTLRPPKLKAVKQAFQNCPYFQGQNIKYEARKTSSDVSDMPLSLEENMQGAKNRVKNIKKEIDKADFYVGMEGGTSKIGDKYFLFGVAYIENQEGIGHYGFSPMMEIPNQIQKELYDHKKDLGIIIDEMASKNDIRSNNGTLGELSDEMIKRAESFTVSIQAAIAPFFNKYWK